MRRALIRASSLSSIFLFAMALAAPGACAQATSLPSKKEATALLQKALEGMKLFEKGSPPFHLVGHVHYVLGTEFVDGQYELLWAAPDRYRENFKVGKNGEMDVALGDKLYTFRSTPALLLPLSEVRNRLHDPLGRSGMILKVKRVYRGQADGTQETCIDTDRSPGLGQVFCYDLAASQLISSTLVPRNELWAGFQMTADHFIPFGEEWFPGHFTQRLANEELELSVDTLEKVQQFDSEVFVPPPNVTARDWCVSPKVKASAPDPSEPVFRMHAPISILAYYLLIDERGRVTESSALTPVASNVDQKMARWLREARFAVLSCNGKAIEYEKVFHPVVLATTDPIP